MRPTDEEIQEKYYTMPTNKAGGEQEKAQWEQANCERLKQQEAAKWARGFDPWHYVEDGDLPSFDTDVFVVLDNEEADKDVAQLIDCGDGKTYEWFCQGDVMGKDEDYIDFEQVKCWMYPIDPKR